MPGFHPEGVASPSLLVRTCWNAWISHRDSFTLLPTGEVAEKLSSREHS